MASSRDAVASITTSRPASASATPFPVMVSTPVDGDAAVTSCPAAASRATMREPARPLPPATRILAVIPSCSRAASLVHFGHEALLLNRGTLIIAVLSRRELEPVLGQHVLVLELRQQV